MDLLKFSKINRKRCESKEGFNQPLRLWSISDWFTALMGEIGEAANFAKKLNRERDGIQGNTQTVEELREGLAKELADAYIYLDLLAQSEGISLSEVVPAKFNETSKKLNIPIYMD